ncbi:hypothetical protein [Streptomyces sp. NBC_00091]|uniref:hypothetical protein n=1 Tax=Streptomyces sp. NBC_00091 TaxID=2975648 RepID=UPI00224F639C|nr:hypothetical protein [Streptomyces sp. NBC_00091]MCX5379993.1 hypothetical protein [Streptomyces sp. NBC_00091]
MTSAATPDTAPDGARPRLGHVTTAGSALAVALVPLVVGVLIAKGMAADPHAPVNALITGGGQRAGLPRAEWSRRGRNAVRRLRTARQGTARRCAAVRDRRRALRRPAAPGAR